MILARGTVGFSGADLQNLVKWVLDLLVGLAVSSNFFAVYSQAAVKAAREGAQAVDLKHFEWAKVKALLFPFNRPDVDVPR